VQAIIESLLDGVLDFEMDDRKPFSLLAHTIDAADTLFDTLDVGGLED